MGLNRLYGWTTNTQTSASAACGSACGAGDNKATAACGSACGAGDNK